MRNIHRFECRVAAKLLSVVLLNLFGLTCLNSTEAVAAVYYVSNAGSDNNDGKSPQTSWRTIARVNAGPFVPGDTILFKRGDCWREQLIPHSGNETGHIRYGAYGSGDKPLLLGSVEKNFPKDWRSEGGNVWVTIDNLPRDVGNIIFDNESSCGVKVWNESDMNVQGKYWYDEEKHLLKLYSSENPALYYCDVECALRRHIILQSSRSYVIYENLVAKYGGAHGIAGGNTHHIIVRDCDFSHIGGGDQYGGGRTVRYGNGVEFWANAHDNLVERCRLWEIYDAALTNQNLEPKVKQYNICYRNNIIWNCEYSFEYWNRPANLLTHHIYFDNNTCAYAGYGWGHIQRPDPSGRHLCFYSSPAAAHNICIRNNIFFEAKGNAFYAHYWPEKAIAALNMDNNCWYQIAGDMILFRASKNKGYTMAQFSVYQSETGNDANSITKVPRWADAANKDFHLTEQSACIDAGTDAGTDVGLKADYEGTAVPKGRAADIGAYEYSVRSAR